MTDDENHRREPASQEAVDGSAEYEVGYGKPPKQHQFQKGRSGNPSGKAKQPKTFGDVLYERLMSEEAVTEDGKARKLTKFAQMVDAMADEAITNKDSKCFNSVVGALKSGGHFKRSDPEQQSGVLVVPIKSTSIEEWERDHGAAAKGKPPPPGFGPVRKPDDEPTPQPIVRVL
jgi:hypothetical protein